MSDFIEGGYVLLARRAFEGQVFLNDGLWKMWTWCIYKAGHKDNCIPITTGRGVTGVQLKRGQFIFGRHSAAKELGVNPETARKRLKKLENLGNITTQSTSHYTIVTVCNFNRYQTPENYKYQPKYQASTKQVPSKYQASTTNNECNNVENEKNVKKENTCLEPENTDSQTESEIILTFPTKGNQREWNLYQPEIDDLADTFPGIDILAECRQARKWCIDHSTRRKTTVGMSRFLTGWITRSINNGTATAISTPDTGNWPTGPGSDWPNKADSKTALNMFCDSVSPELAEQMRDYGGRMIKTKGEAKQKELFDEYFKSEVFPIRQAWTKKHPQIGLHRWDGIEPTDEQKAYDD